MAAGQVRCGGCGVAFNALEHLSETKPAAPPLKEELSDPDPPELRPDEPAELEADTPPDSISAEQSAALLKTLDELAGDDIRIEDTGVEWRVIDEDAVEPAEDEGADLIADTGSLKFTIEDEPEFELPEQGPSEPSRVIDEMLFDDNTVLPDDFDEVVEAPSQLPVEEPPSTAPEPEEPQFDLDLSEPDEWDDLLGDLEDQPAAPVEDDIEESEAPPDVDTQFEIQAEAMGIDLSGIYESADEEPPAELQLDAEPEPEPDMATEPEIEAEDIEAADIAETSIEEDLIAAAFEAEAAVRTPEETSFEEAPDVEETSSEEVLALEEDEDAEVQDEQPENEEEDIDLEVDLQVEDEAEIEDDVEDIAMGFDNDVERDIETLSMSLDDEEDTVATGDEDHVIPEMSEEEKTINMMIDQELLNIAVEDEDGFASTIVQLQPDAERVEDPDKDDASDKPGKKKDKKKKDKPAKDSAEPPADVTVETIIMEGDFIRGELDRELHEEDAEEKPDAAESPGYSIPINREKDDYARRREMTSAPPGAGTWAGIVALVLLLGVQFIHQSREALATVPAFNSAIGPVYRMLGRPLTPEWNIGGWRFEATKGDTDETGELLTIYSRVGNNSEEPLPYPLLHLSLTDRFEDIIGSAIMEPAEYLPENADPRKPVPPGSSFNAVISIESPSPDATGFKLNVCYRLTSGQLRCADHDFK
jgi:pilus assembly protein FimV